jgi:hypothetical protein
MPIARPPRREDHYRDLAQQCVEIARTVPDEKVRASLNEMAQAWLRLAEGQDGEDEGQFGCR